MLVKNDGNKDVEFAGMILQLGARSFVVPPLSLGSANLHKELIGRLRKMEGGIDLMAESLPLIHAALVRNYPELTVDDVGSLVDIASFNAAIRCVWNVSGLLAKSEEGASGESNPPQATA